MRENQGITELEDAILSEIARRAAKLDPTIKLLPREVPKPKAVPLSEREFQRRKNRLLRQADEIERRKAS